MYEYKTCSILVFYHQFFHHKKAVALQAWSGPEGSRKLRFPDFMTTAQDGGKVASVTHRRPLPPENVPGTHFCYRLRRPQGHSAIRRIFCQRNISMTHAGIEPVSFRFVAHYLNHCATVVPFFIIKYFVMHTQKQSCTQMYLIDIYI